MVNFPKSAKSDIPICDLDFRNETELKRQLALHVKHFGGGQRVEIDTSASQILVDGVHKYNFSLMDPPRPRPSAAVMF
ncbi:hypothetical protein [Arthrobacter alpinus]|uniref:hypothetical protein n=1 Tax=Arthrobacter alpinus TaxID=656366 RepID=UPI001114EA63|nr:hypothetical protein [Arthrobacter alpinus]